MDWGSRTVGHGIIKGVGLEDEVGGEGGSRFGTNKLTGYCTKFSK